MSIWFLNFVGRINIQPLTWQHKQSQWWQNCKVKDEREDVLEKIIGPGTCDDC